MSTFVGGVLVVAPPTLQRQGLLLLLRQTWPHLSVVLTADGQQARELLSHHAYRLAIVDALLPGPNLALLLTQLHQARPAQSLLLLTGSYAPAEWLRPAPALTIAPPAASPEDVMALIAGLLGDGAARPAAALPTIRLRPPATPFSRRELEVLRLVMSDCCNQQIADRLCLSVRTVESHRRALLQKTGTRSLVGLVVQAVREGWVAA